MYLLTHKSELFEVFKDFVAKSEVHFNLKVENVYCDNGGEYISNDMKNFFKEKGISYHLTVPYTPQQNSVAERMNRTLTEKARSMINSANLQKCFWGEAILTATYLLNISPTKALTTNKTPFEMWHNKKPKLYNLKVFGCTVFIHDKNRKSKFDEKSFKGIFVGYAPNGYKIFNPRNNKFIKARDVIFDEYNFTTSRPVLSFDEGGDSESSNELKMPKFTETDNISKPDDNNKAGKSGETERSVKETDNEHINENVQLKNLKSAEANCRKSGRIKNLPKVSFNEDEGDTENYLLYAESVINSVPKDFQDIEEREDKHKWLEAIKEEINSLGVNNTWSIVQRPVNKNFVDCKWVFTIKNNVSGNPCRYKARLIAKVFSQKYLEDYSETFAPVHSAVF